MQVPLRVRGRHPWICKNHPNPKCRSGSSRNAELRTSQVAKQILTLDQDLRSSKFPVTKRLESLCQSRKRAHFALGQSSTRFFMEIAVGLLIGLAIGTTGVGGGPITAPALILLFGYEPRRAVATALVFATSIKLW